MATVNNVHQIVVALQQHGQDMEREIADEMAVLAQMTARTMKRLAPKSRSTLVQTIAVHKTGDMEYEIQSGADYSYYVETGVKPGGKGLPRFFDPASASIVDWLQSHPRGGGFAPRKAAFGSKSFQSANLALRDRYEGLAWHVRKHGVKAQPFVMPTFNAMEPVVLSRLDLAVRRVLGARRSGGGLA